MGVAHRFAVLAASFGLLALSAPALAQMAVPPPATQTTADCARPVYASDQLVCGDTELRQLDARLAAILDMPAAPNGSALIESDDQWFRRRSRCAFETDHRGCLVQSYRDRLAFRESATQMRERKWGARCTIWGQVEIDRVPNGYMFVRTRNDQSLRAIAAPVPEQSVWKPVWTAMVRGSRIDFTSHDGRRISCKTKR